jgi:hypothetical protein
LVEDKLQQRSDRLTSLILIEIHNILIEVKEAFEETKRIQTENQLSFNALLNIEIENRHILRDLLKIQSEDQLSLNTLLNVEIENRHILRDLLKIQSEDQEHLRIISKLQPEILKELKDAADEGDYRQITDVVTSTALYIINTETAPSHPIRSFVLYNNGPNTMYIGWNLGIVGPSIEDVVQGKDSRFIPLANGEHFKTSGNNREVIKNIHLAASDVNTKKSNFRLIMTW